MLEKYIGFRYILKIAGQEIKEDDPRRRSIQRIAVNLRRSGLSSLNIMFSDSDLQWRNFFTVPTAIKVEFYGFNFDGTADEHFEGYVSTISPATAKNLYDLEIMCVNAPPAMTNPQSTARTFKKVSRRQLLNTLASEQKVRLSLYSTPELDVVEDEINLSVNTSYVEFITNTLEEIGYAFRPLTLSEWVVTPLLSPNSSALGGMYTNIKDTTLLDFQPSFSPYSYETKDESSSSSSSSKSSSAIDPTTKKSNSSSNKSKPTNTPKKSSSKKPSSSKQGEMYYDSKAKRWIRVT